MFTYVNGDIRLKKSRRQTRQHEKLGEQQKVNIFPGAADNILASARSYEADSAPRLQLARASGATRKTLPAGALHQALEGEER
jgi:hypothetical protein